MNVKAKILLVLMALSMFTLVVTGFFAFMTINAIGGYAERSSTVLGATAVADSTAALRDSTKEYLLQIASDQASISNILFMNVEDELLIARAQADALRSGTLAPGPGYTSFSGGIQPGREQPSLIYTVPGFQGSAYPGERSELEAMTGIFDAIGSVNPDLSTIYAATGSGMLLTLPPASYNEPGFDPRTRGWYTNAIVSEGTVWTGPYVDVTGAGLIMTCSALVNGTNEDPDPWVIATDVTVDTINAEILDWTFGESGYAILIDDRGNVISRPGMAAGNASWDQEFHTENVFEAEDPELRAIGMDMLQGNTGVGQVTVNGSAKFVAYAPIESLHWSIAVVMPLDEVVAPVVATGQKITDASSETRGQITAQTDLAGSIFIVLFFVVLALVIAFSVQLSRVMTRPVEALNNGTLALGRGDLGYRVDIRTGDEFEDLAGSFNRMASDLKKNMEELEKTTAEKERYAREMEIARSIQQSFLPQAVPEIKGFEIAVLSLPAMEVGGDFYDFIPVKDGRWGFAIADVSGKGVSAALFMALSRTLIGISGRADRDPLSAISRANRLIASQSNSCMFVTLFYGVLDPASGVFSYVNAGHNPPLLVRADPAGISSLRAGGIALGVVEDADLEEKEVRLSRGDYLVMFTDGVTEAADPEHRLFGDERLNEWLLRHRGLPVQEMVPALAEELQKFARGAPQSDDITLVVLRMR